MAVGPDEMVDLEFFHGGQMCRLHRSGQGGSMGLAPGLNGLAEMGSGFFAVALQFGYFFTRRFDFSLGRAHVLELALFPIAGGLLQAFLGLLKKPLRGFAKPDGACTDLQFELALLFGNLGQLDFFRRHTA